MTESGDLKGVRVVVTRREEDAQPLLARLREQGADAVCVPLIRIGPPSDTALLIQARDSITDFDWVALTSRNAARALLQDLAVPSRGRPRVAALGQGTADAVRAAGWPVDVVASGRGGAALAETMLSDRKLRGATVLFPTSNIVLADLGQRLSAAKVSVHQVEVYRNMSPEPTAGRQLADHLGQPGAIAIFASPSAVQRAAKLLTELGREFSGVAAVAIGATTAAALETTGFKRVQTAERPDDQALVAATLRAQMAFRAVSPGPEESP